MSCSIRSDLVAKNFVFVATLPTLGLLSAIEADLAKAGVRSAARSAGERRIAEDGAGARPLRAMGLVGSGASNGAMPPRGWVFLARGSEQEVMVVNVGDRIVVESEKVGVPPRRGEVRAVSGSLLTVCWENGQQSMFVPSAGSLRVEQPASPGPG